MAYTKTEQEVIVLKAAWEMIHEMVNFEIFEKLNRVKNTNLMFKTATHQRVFNVLLVDFLSQPRNWPFDLPSPPHNAAKSERCILFLLKRICDEPQLNRDGGDLLRTPLDAFQQWLETECVVEKVYLPSIEVESDIRVRRMAFIKICGNIAKHNFTRLSVNVDEICEILKANEVAIDTENGYLVLSEFHEWFHDNIFSYHSSAIAEFLNNIRWGIYNYLRPEFVRSFTKDGPNSLGYRFQFPPDCNGPAARSMYWDLMNAVRSEPFMPRFEVTEYLKMRY